MKENMLDKAAARTKMIVGLPRLKEVMYDRLYTMSLKKTDTSIQGGRF